MSVAAARPLDGNTSAMPDAAPLARVLESYLAGLEAGRPADPDGLIAAHPELAGPLRAWLTFMHQANSLNEAPAGPFAADPGHARVIAPPGGSALTRRWIRDGSSPHRLRPEPSDDDAQIVAVGSDALPDSPDGAGAGRYQVLGEIARGGMGVVLKARDVDLGRDLALKVLQAQHRGDPDVVSRFVEEARIGGQLEHPGIVPVHDLGTLADHRPYFTMKLVKGRTLAALLAERPSPKADLPRFLTVFEQVCQTVAYAHARRVIHRDLKPANVMVGSFGEVQVVDWGFAKVLSEGGADDEPRAVAQEETAILTTRSGPASSGSESQPGSVLGTPSYMAPEQARGEVDRIDERADVFGLGAILCEILVGRPPFGGPTREEIQARAARGDLAKVLRRLDASGADAELVALARDCLAAEPEHRPPDAGEVVRRMSAYQAGVQDRLRAAERARVQAQTRAEEERKRRRVTVALAASLLGLGLLGGGGSAYMARHRMEQAARVDRALSGVELLYAEANWAGDDLTRWLAARHAALALGGFLADTPDGPARDRLAALVRDVTRAADAAEADQKLLARLVDIRSAESDDPGGAATDARYAEAFRMAALDVTAAPPADVGARIRARPAAVRVELAAALDDWAALRWGQRHDPSGARRFTEIARLADPDPWRNRLREAPRIASRAERLASAKDLAGSARIDELPAVSLSLLAGTLYHLGDPTGAEAILRKAVTRYPGDVWMNYGLGECLERLERPEEAIRYYTAARSLRPETAHQLAHLLAERGETDQAIAIFQDLTRLRPKDGTHLGCLSSVLKDRGLTEKAQAVLDEAISILSAAIERDPRRPDAHMDLAFALDRWGKRDQAIAEFRETLRLRPDFALAHYSLGHALFEQGKVDEAIAEYREAIHLNPGYPEAHNNLGYALLAQGKLDEAIVQSRQALRLKPALATAHTNLGTALFRQGKADEAIAAYREVVRLKPQHAAAHYDLGVALSGQGKRDEAIAEYREAIRLQPEYFPARYNLGNALGEQGKRDAAIREYQEVIRLKPDFAEAHTNLGNALLQRGKPDEAIAEFRAALQIKPNLAEAHSNLGNVLRRQGKLDEAISELREAIRLNPHVAQAHINLGVALLDLSKFDEAIAAYRQAIRLKPHNASAHYMLGNSLLAEEEWDEAIAAYREAIRLKPDFAEAHTNLGNALRNQGRLDEATAEYRTALLLKPDLPEAHINIGFVFRSRGEYAEAIAEFRQARDLARATNPRLAQRIEPELTATEQEASLAARVSAVLAGLVKLTDADEAVGLARFCHEKKRHAASARFWTEAFQLQPKLTQDVEAAHRYNAACAAALAGCGQGRDDPPLDEAARARWRTQALDWLEADLVAWSKRLKEGPPQARPSISKTLEHWKGDPDLAGLRDPGSLEKLPRDEQDGGRALWKKVDALLARTAGVRP